MVNDTSLLEVLMDEDFGLNTREGSRWGNTDDHSSMVLDKDKGIFYWNSRGIVGTAITYLIQVRGMTVRDAKKYIEDFGQLRGLTVVKNNKNQDVVVSPKLVDVFFENGKNNREYFYKRGLNDRIIDSFKLGFYNDFNTVPFYENFNFKNFQLRRENPKTIYGYYRGIGPLMFNSDILRLVDKIYYTEGPVDAMIMIQNGLPAVSSNCSGGYLGKWISRFVNIKEINILFDNDEAGNLESKRLAKFLGESRCKIYNFWDFGKFGNGYDPVDYFRDGHTANDLKKLLDDKIRYSCEVL
jgi:hypothetical protein